MKKEKRVRLFLGELKTLMLKYNISISHEDCHGGFELENFNEYNWEWISDASDFRVKNEGCGKQCLVDGKYHLQCGEYDKKDKEIFLCHECLK